ncbi:MAG: methyltransferase domain-containing protein [Opitutaceae bacterium]
MKRVNLGSGTVSKPGFISVDADPDVCPDVVAPATKLPFENDSVDVIEACHLIEHLLPWDVETAVKEWLRVLKPGGHVVVECPDLGKAVRWLSAHKDFSAFASRGLRPLFGEVAGENAYMTHRWGFTPETLAYLFSHYGFDPVKIEKARAHVPDRDLRAVAFKPLRPAIAERRAEIHWFLWASRATASARLQGHYIHEHLSRAGVSSHLVLTPPVMLTDTPWHWEKNSQMIRLVRDGIAVFVKLRGAGTEQLMKNLREAGAWVVYVDCDLEPRHRTGFAADVVVCPTPALAAHYREGGAADVRVIPDVVDYWIQPEALRSRNVEKRKLTAGWVGSAGNWPALESVRAILSEPEFADFSLLTISDHPGADIVWRLEEMPANLARMDLAIIPTAGDASAKAKSNNRLTLFMAAGVPVIAGRIPAYEAIVREGVNGFHAGTDDEFRTALRKLRDPAARSKIAVQAYADAQNRFSREVVGNQWRALFDELAAHPKPHGWLHGPVDARERTAALRDARAIACEALFRLVWKRGSKRRALGCFGRLLQLAPFSAEARRLLAGIAASWLRRRARLK